MDRRAVTLAGMLALSLAAAACASGPIAISSEPLAGTIGGSEWTLASAETNATLSANSPTFVARAYAEALPACTGAGSAANGNGLILNLPRTAGDYRVGESLSQTFYMTAGNTNYVATQGRVIVEEVTTTTIRAGAHFRFDDANEVDGQFAVTICSDL